METVFDLPEGENLPPIQDLISGRPTSWQGMPVVWSSTTDPEPVFIRTFAAPRSGDGNQMVYLFGARYELAEALVGGESLGSGHFVEFFVAQRSDGGWAVHRLLNRLSSTYSATDEPEDYLPAAEVESPERYAFDDPPTWKVSEAWWPTSDGDPMIFLGQVALPETDLTRTRLTWGVTFYLFWASTNQVDSFKLVEQDPDQQTAEEHYALEEALEEQRYCK